MLFIAVGQHWQHILQMPSSYFTNTQGWGREGGGERELTKLFARFALDQTHSKHTNILQRTVLHKAGNYVSSIVRGRGGEGVEQS